MADSAKNRLLRSVLKAWRWIERAEGVLGVWDRLPRLVRGAMTVLGFFIAQRIADFVNLIAADLVVSAIIALSLGTSVWWALEAWAARRRTRTKPLGPLWDVSTPFPEPRRDGERSGTSIPSPHPRPEIVFVDSDGAWATLPADRSKPALFLRARFRNMDKAEVGRALNAQVIFTRPDGTSIRPMTGRWADYEDHGDALAEQIDLEPGRTALLDIAMRYPDESVAYGHNSESISRAPDGRDNDRAICDDGEYRVRVELRGRNVQQDFTFTLQTVGSILALDATAGSVPRAGEREDAMPESGRDDRRDLGVLPRDVVHSREAGTAPPMPPCGRR